MSILYIFFAIVTCVIAYNIEKSIGWSIASFFLWPLAWVKWLVLKQINLTILKNIFSSFFS